MRRREFLKSVALVGVGAIGAQARIVDIEQFRQFFRQLVRLARYGSLPIPKLATSEIVDGVRVFAMHIQKRSHTFFDGVATHTYGINSSYLGETIRIKNGERVKIDYFNHLDEPTTMHGHGMHVPAIMDGGVHQIIEPGTVWSTQYRVKQEACTNWYHPHLMGKTAEQVYKGLAGCIIIEDDVEELPREYGVDDIPLVLQERRFVNAQIDYSPSRMEIMHGYTGGELIVNGAIAPTFRVYRRLLRMRLLNGSNASLFRVALNHNLSFWIIAGDNSFLPRPELVDEVMLSPGERVEIVLDMDGFEGRELLLVEKGSQRTILHLYIAQALEENGAIPSSLIALEPMEEAKRKREFVFGMRRMKFTINGKSMDMRRIDERIPVNEPEIWEVYNPMGMAHNFHIHATHFRILERNGSSANVKAWERGYKDTVFLAPRDRVKLYVKMRDYVDEKSPYMYHCHFLEHEDNGMMGQFVVV